MIQMMKANNAADMKGFVQRNLENVRNKAVTANNKYRGSSIGSTSKIANKEKITMGNN